MNLCYLARTCLSSPDLYYICLICILIPRLEPESSSEVQCWWQPAWPSQLPPPGPSAWTTLLIVTQRALAMRWASSSTEGQGQEKEVGNGWCPLSRSHWPRVFWGSVASSWLRLWPHLNYPEHRLASGGGFELDSASGCGKMQEMDWGPFWSEVGPPARAEWARLQPLRLQLPWESRCRSGSRAQAHWFGLGLGGNSSNPGTWGSRAPPKPLGTRLQSQ